MSPEHAVDHRSSFAIHDNIETAEEVQAQEAAVHVRHDVDSSLLHTSKVRYGSRDASVYPLWLPSARVPFWGLRVL